MIKKHSYQFLILLVILTLILPVTSSCANLKNTIESTYTDKNTLSLWDSGPLTLDPAISSEMSSHLYVMQIYSGLVKFDSQLKPVPDIAERWEISDEGKTYTFYLRKDVKFQDGRKVKAQDIKYSLERACQPSTGSQTASTYLGDIVGAEEVIAGKASNIKGIKIVDDYTIQIDIDAPKAYFLSKMAYPTAFVVDKDNVESGRDWWKKPNGTGPYRLAKWEEGSLILLEPNKYFYGTMGKVRVAFHLLSGIPMSLYETGKIDVLEVSKSYIDRVSDKAGPFHDQLHIFPEFSLHYIGFNISKPPFDDIYVRQAFCHAVNKERIIKITQKGMCAEANGIIPQGMPGFNPNVAGLQYDPQKARDLLAKSKYKSAANLPEITITVPGWGGVDVEDYLGAAILDWKNNLGVSVRVRLLDPNAFHYNLMEEADEMYVLGWIADYPDPQNFLDTLFSSGSDYNISHFASKDFDTLLRQAASEQNYERRMAIYQQAEQLVIDQAPVLPLWFGRNYVLVSPEVKGYTIDPLGVPRFYLVSLDR